MWVLRTEPGPLEERQTLNRWAIFQTLIHSFLDGTNPLGYAVCWRPFKFFWTAFANILVFHFGINIENKADITF